MYHSELQRCLTELDVPGLVKIWAEVSPHAPPLAPAEAIIAAHMARVEARHMHKNLKLYSLAFLDERGYRKLDGQWVKGASSKVIAECVAIASKSNIPGVADKIMNGMRDAYLHAVAGGVTEPPMHREQMLKARQKIRSKLALV